jgi:ABC-2 type transport system ATP-binding protein
MNDEPAVSITGLFKRYGAVTAVDGVDLQIGRGEIFGVLGRNGAGKTTLIEILEGLRESDAGEVRVLGFDPAKELDHLKESIGVQLQSSSFFRKLKVVEVLAQFRSYYSRKSDIDELLRMVSLSEKRNSYIDDLSGGQRQRLALALSMINDPQIIFLDEPTSGLDAPIRRQVWQTVQDMKNAGKTIILTTHYIEEAERLCDRVCILESGRIIAVGAPDELISKSLGTSVRIQLTTERPVRIEGGKGIKSVDASVDGKAEYTIEAENTGPALVELVNSIEAQNSGLLELQIKRGTLEDVFVELTGEKIK